MTKLMDFHCHTTASDGALEPAQLIERAVDRNINVLAITDHDTLAGFRQAQQISADLTLISGIELSCVWQGITIHVVGLNMDAEHPVMLQAEQHQSDARTSRSRIIAERVGKKFGQTLDLDSIASYAQGGVIGRPHFAKYLVDQGWVSSTQAAFNKLLGAGKVGDVNVSWPELHQVVEWIVSSGGIAVMAHAHRYKMTRTKLCRCLDEFVDAGGSAMEVAYGLMSNAEQARMVELAKRYELLGSCGSDFHAINRYGLDLGVMPRFPSDIKPVWHEFL